MTTATLVKPPVLDFNFNFEQEIIDKYPLGLKVTYKKKKKVITEYHGGSAYTDICRTKIRYKNTWKVKYKMTPC